MTETIQIPQDVELFQVDAFANQIFQGNQAGVCITEQPLPVPLMQAIAAENAVAETAFCVPQGKGFTLRWFTPSVEVELCGHGTLASAHVLFCEKGYQADSICFQTRRAGDLTVTRGEPLRLDLPANLTVPATEQQRAAVCEALGQEPVEVRDGRYLMARLPDQQAIAEFQPSLDRIGKLAKPLIITALGDDKEVDFVSRFFAPHVGVREDPVTGSAHCQLAPYWGELLGKKQLRARQLSRRGGTMGCRVIGDRVELLGECVTFFRGKMSLPPNY